MKPEIAQNLSQIFIVVGIILTALAGYGNHYYGKQIDNKNGKELIEKIDDKSNESINNADKNTKKVLTAIDDVKKTVKEIKTSDKSNIKKITYPEKGAYGLNILSDKFESCKPGEYSVNIIVPKKENVKIKISGEHWGFSMLQPLTNWNISKYNSKEKSRYFTTLNPGESDLKLQFQDNSKIEILAFENNSDKPSWRKTIIIEK